jgi:signal transduction histidine kinase
MPEDSTIPPVDATLRRIVVAYRILVFIWMTALVVVTLITDEAAARGIVIGSWVIAVVACGAVVAASRDRKMLTSAPLLVGDGLAAVCIGLAPGLAHSGDLFFGGWLLSWLLLLMYARPTVWIGLGGVAAMAATQIATPLLSTARELRATDAAGDVAVLAVTTAVFGWGMHRIRASEQERIEAEAALSQERLLRSRADDRAEIAGHLHDSVLQTLALIQRRSEEAAEVAHLARRQEQELRRFIGEMSSRHERSLRAALHGVAAEVEDLHRVHVDVVVVGEREVDDATDALVGAVREALVNAAVHSGESTVSLYAEADAARTVAFVRDRGAGFDPAGAGGDRRGLRESIIGRIERHGGRAVITSAPGRGTEVELIIRGGHRD